MKHFTYYLSFGDKKMKIGIDAVNRTDADKIVRSKLVIDKVVEGDPTMDKINDLFDDVFSALCSNPLHKYEVKLRGSCSKCKGKN